MQEHQIVKTVKRIRVELDKYFTVMGKMEKSREISIAITSTQNAKMWLGQVLKTLDQPNPYPDSKDATNSKIAPTADVYDGDVDTVLNGLNHIQQVKVMRQRLTASYEEMERIERESKLSEKLTKIGFHSLAKSWEYIVEANMWLGMELGRINNKTK